jgi:selenocysteine lyase/cysteine desulfurase
MREMKIDLLCFSGHKGLMAPQGTGCLLVREGIAILPFKVGGTGVQLSSKSGRPKCRRHSKREH